MSISHCLNQAVSQKEITQAAADELDLLYQRFVKQNAIVMGDAEARRRAAEQIAGRLEASAAQRRRAALLQASAIERTWNAVSRYKNARGEVNILLALPELIETFGKRDEGLVTGSVDGRRKAILGQAQAELEGMLEAFDRRLVGGRKNKALMENVVKELAGEGTGDQAAKDFAAAWMTTAETLRQRYNELGGAIGKIDKWIAPQMHDGQALRKIGFEQWSKRISGLLDWNEMRHALSGDPILPDERIEVLRHVYDTVTTEGWFNRLPSQRQGRGALYKQHADHRFLIFKDADSWLSYQRDFGQGDPFAAMMGHLKLMSRDIAAMQILGPNPEATLQWLKDRAMQEAQKARRGEASLVARGVGVLGREISDPVSRAKSTINRVDAMWTHYTGAADVVANETAANTMSTLRNMTSAGSLGSAMLSALSDPGFGSLARKFAMGASVPGGLVNQAASVIRNFRGMNRAQAVRAGLILDSAANTFGTKAREANLISGPVMSRAVADTVMRVQGLQAWTQAGKHGFGLDLMGHVADQLANRWDELTPEVQRLMRRYGLDEQDWRTMGLASLHDLSPDGEGAHILRPREIADLTFADMQRLWREDRQATAAAHQVLEVWDSQLLNISEDLKGQIDAVIKAARDAGANKDQILQMLASTLQAGDTVTRRQPRGIPKRIRDQLWAPTMSREGLLRALQDIRDGSYALTEIARTQWRDSPQFQALPEWFRRVVSNPDISVGEARQMLAAMIEAPPSRPISTFPSVPSDAAIDKWRRHFRDLAERYHEMILQETAYAVPEPTLRGKSIVLGRSQPGTLQGEAFRAFGQFKSFGVSVMLLHGGRVFNEMAAGRKAAGVQYAMAGTAVLTLLGMASLQNKQMAKGEDMRDMTDWRVWGAAMVQAGGFGIYGDFFLADQNRLGGGLTQTIVGPIPGRAADLLKATLGNVQQVAEGKPKTNVGRELLRTANSWNPLASLWFTRLAWDRLANRPLQRIIDPEASQAMAREEQMARRNRGTEYWWRLQEAFPYRAPQIGESRGR